MGGRTPAHCILFIFKVTLHSALCSLKIDILMLRLADLADLADWQTFIASCSKKRSHFFFLLATLERVCVVSDCSVCFKRIMSGQQFYFERNGQVMPEHGRGHMLEGMTSQCLLSKRVHRFSLQLNGHPEQVCHLTNGLRSSICN